MKKQNQNTTSFSSFNNTVLEVSVFEHVGDKFKGVHADGTEHDLGAFAPNVYAGNDTACVETFIPEEEKLWQLGTPTEIGFPVLHEVEAFKATMQMEAFKDTCEVPGFDEGKQVLLETGEYSYAEDDVKTNVLTGVLNYVSDVDGWPILVLGVSLFVFALLVISQMI